MASAPDLVSSRRAYDGMLINVDIDTVRAPDGSEMQLELIRHPGASAVVALLDDPKAKDPSVLMLHQFRHATGGPIWEVPAGVLEPGEDPEACARRELKEETGATAAHFDHLTSVFTTPGFTDERIHLFLAFGLEAGEPNHEADEFIEVEAKPMSEAMAMIRDGAIVDAKTIVSLMYVAGYRMNW